MTLSRTITFLSLLFAAAIPAGAVPPQTSFCAEAEPGDAAALTPVTLPDEVLHAVMRTAQGRDVLTNAAENNRRINPADLLKGAPVRLARGTVYILIGDYPLSGADNSWFWIVRQSGRKATVLAFLQANCVEIEQHKTRGYHDVTTLWGSAAGSRTETYQYTGKNYQLVRSTPGR